MRDELKNIIDIAEGYSVEDLGFEVREAYKSINDNWSIRLRTYSKGITETVPETKSHIGVIVDRFENHDRWNKESSWAVLGVNTIDTVSSDYKEYMVTLHLEGEKDEDDEVF